MSAPCSASENYKPIRIPTTRMGSAAIMQVIARAAANLCSCARLALRSSHSILIDRPLGSTEYK